MDQTEMRGFSRVPDSLAQIEPAMGTEAINRVGMHAQYALGVVFTHPT
jgi:hypothetical protein